MKTGLFLGRFQPFHKGHLSVVNKALSEVDKLLIGIGSSEQGYNKSNPFTFEERARMIQNSLEGNYEIVGIPDIYNYSAWVEHVADLCPDFDVVYAGSPITRKLFGEKGYEIRSFDAQLNKSSTLIREKMYADEPWEDDVPEGTLKVLKEMSGAERVRDLIPKFYQNPIITVDAIARYGDGIVLIERGKEPFKGCFALPGGHVEYGQSTEQAIVREMSEETGLDFSIEGLLGVYSYPNRDPRGHYVTIVYHGTAEGELEAGDDAAKVVVSDFNNLPELAFDHADIMAAYKQQLELREKLAELEHEQWMYWSKIKDETNKSHLWVPYSELPEAVKDEDRIWADKVLKILEGGR